LFFKKLPESNVKVEFQDAMHVFIIWTVDSPSNDILNQANGILAGEIQVIPTTVSTTLSPPNPIEREYKKKGIN
jgi:hypothetical protein